MSDNHIHPNKRVHELLHGLFRGIYLQQYLPSGRFSRDDEYFQIVLWQIPTPAHLDKSHFLDIKAIVLQLSAITRFVVDRIETGRLLKVWSTLFAIVKLAGGTVQTAKHLLSTRHNQKVKGIAARLITPISSHARLFVKNAKEAALVPPFAPVVNYPTVEPAGCPGFH